MFRVVSFVHIQRLLAGRAFFAFQNMFDKRQVRLQGRLGLGEAELGDEKRGQDAENLAEERAQNTLVEARGNSVPGTLERVFESRTQHVVQVYLRRLNNKRIINKYQKQTLYFVPVLH